MKCQVNLIGIKSIMNAFLLLTAVTFWKSLKNSHLSFGFGAYKKSR